MENGDSCQTGMDPDGSRRCDGTGERQDHEAPPSIGRSIRPGAPCPETVLVVVMSDGSYLLVGYPQCEPAAWAIARDAGLLHRALGDAFGHGQSAGSEIDEATLPGNETTHAREEQPAMIREDRELAELAQSTWANPQALHKLPAL